MAKDKTDLSASIIRATWMTQEALRRIHNRDLPWGLAEITAEPIRRGRPLSELVDEELARRFPKNLSGWEDVPSAIPGNEALRTILVHGHCIGAGALLSFDATCELCFRGLDDHYSVWEPVSLEMRLDPGFCHFTWTNERHYGLWNFAMSEPKGGKLPA
ncbi:MAG: hypothetical protein HY457_02835 [Parcubacteria group bacterium]|nr:hypothetical protein [Parcubacteria group bacterium]